MSAAWLNALPVVVPVAAVAVLLVILWRQRIEARRITAHLRELERLSLELIRSNRMKSEFLASISHELRTPLNAIVGFIELLQADMYGELTPRQRVPVERIEGSATHLRQLVDQVLDLAKMAAGRMEVHPQPIEARSFVLDVLTEMESLARERGLQAGLAPGPPVPRVSADPVHLRQILVNLVGNAIKFTPRGGITLQVRHLYDSPPIAGEAQPAQPSADGHLPRRWWLALEVRDTGIGIAPADHARIFDEFEQVAAGPRSDSPVRGTGLGLPISRRLAHLMGGTITLESELGRGAVFTLWLPAPEPITAAVSC